MNAAPYIAVVDDDPSIRSALSSLLRSIGYTVGLFDSAEAFLESLKGGSPACLLTDIQMPGMGGLELQASMGKDHPTVPVLVMTAFPDPAVRERALANGATCFLAKPFDADELLSCVRRACRE